MRYALVTGSPPSRDVGKQVDLGQFDGWDVCVIASPNGRQFIDDEALSVQTGHMVRSTYNQPVVAMPFSNWAQIHFPAVTDAMRKLTDWGVTVLVGDEVYPQHEPAPTTTTCTCSRGGQRDVTLPPGLPPRSAEQCARGCGWQHPSGTAGIVSTTVNYPELSVSRCAPRPAAWTARQQLHSGRIIGTPPW